MSLDQDRATSDLAHLGLATERDALFMLAAVEQAFEIRISDSPHPLETVGDLHALVLERLTDKGVRPDDLWPRLCKIVAHETGAPAARITETTRFLDDTPPPGRIAILLRAALYLAGLAALTALLGWLGRAQASGPLPPPGL